MRTGSSDIQLRGHRDRSRWNSRLLEARKSRQYRFDLEGLEVRTLLATIPPAIPTSSPLVNLSQPMGNGPGAQEDSPLVVVDPLNPQKIVSVWVNNDTADIPFPGPQVFVEGDYSVNGGQSWASFQATVVLADPNTNNPVLPYLQITNPSVSFDRNGNFYVLLDEHNGGGTSGALVLEKYAFTGDAPVAVRFRQPSGGSAAFNVIYQWLPPGDQAFQPTMAVDDNIASFTDPTTGQVQTDISSGNVYIAWATGTVCASDRQHHPRPFFNPERNRDGHLDEWRAGFQRSRDRSTPSVMGQPPSAMRCLQSQSVRGDWPVRADNREMPGFLAVKSPLGGVTLQPTSSNLL